jgi:uncharacterized protein (TIGR00299 family) protein
MRIAYFDGTAGAAGDMIVGALLDAGLPLEAVREAVDRLALPGVSVAAERVERSGFAGTHFRVAVEGGDRAHHGLDDILRILDRGGLAPRVREQAAKVFRRLAEAEARVHGRPSVAEAHFHEVGAMDAVVDVVGACVGFAHLGIEQVRFSTLATGHGKVRCAHGWLPVPAPATAALLEGVPVEDGGVDRELLTPTGAAVLTTLGAHGAGAPAMTLEAVGCGAGTRELDGRPNLLRVRIGTAAAAAGEADVVRVLETNLDDMSPEHTAYATEKLMAAGARDVFVTPVQMKKGRPGLLLTVIAAEDRADALTDILFEQTTTFGVRGYRAERRVLARETHTVDTSFGPIRVKTARSGDRLVRVAPEYEDCRAAAEKAGVALESVYEAARAAFRQGDGR